MALARRGRPSRWASPATTLGAAHDPHNRRCPRRFCPRLLRRPRRGEARRRRQGDGEEGRQEGEEGREEGRKEGREEGGEGRGARRRPREVNPHRRPSACSPRPRGVRSGASLFAGGEILPDPDGTELALPRASPDGRVHSELPKEINMIRTIAAALAAFCFVSFGAFAQGSTTDTGTSAKTETKSDTKKASKKHKKMKKAKKADSATKTDSSSTAAPK